MHATGFDPGVLHEDRGAIDALVCRLSDDDAKTVLRAGAILRQVIFLDAAFGAQIAPAAREALPKWCSDLSTTGVLERLIEASPKQ